LAIIYKATNGYDGNAYIGWTENDLAGISAAHLKLATENEDDGDFKLFHQALREFGPEVFIWEALAETTFENGYKDADRFITEHETNKDGYNVVLKRAKRPRKPARAKTKRPGRKQTQATKAKLSEALRGKPKTDAHKLALSAGHATMKESGLFYQDPEYKAKISAANKGKKRTKAQTEKNRQAGYRRWYGNYKDVY
jgi:hypothetical protein